jgi:ElaB/YqjD/DUF883 family membrane-anchored ribosome-binding protein
MIRNRLYGYHDKTGVNRPRDWMQDVVDTAQMWLDKGASTVQKRIVHRPATALGIGLSLGVLAGCLVKRR